MEPSTSRRAALTSPTKDTAAGATLLARAIYDNDAEVAQELGFHRGDVLTVLKKDPTGFEGWWVCSLAGKVGIAPGNRLEVLGAVTPKKKAMNKPTETLVIASVNEVETSPYDELLPMAIETSEPSISNPFCDRTLPSTTSTSIGTGQLNSSVAEAGNICATDMEQSIYANFYENFPDFGHAGDEDGDISRHSPSAMSTLSSTRVTEASVRTSSTSGNILDCNNTVEKEVRSHWKVKH